MDIHTAGLSHLFSPLAEAPAAHRANEDAYYASYDHRLMPAWLVGLAAALNALRHRSAEEPASILVTQMA